MKKCIILITVILMLLYIVSCSSETENSGNQALDSKTAKPTQFITPSIAAEPTEPFLSPTSSVIRNDEISLSKDEKDKLEVLIKWIYDINLVHSGDDGQNLQLPKNISLLSNDSEKIRFVTDMVAIEHTAGLSSSDGMNYTFSKEEADAIVYSAVGEKFDEHKASEYVSGYSGGIYSYSMVGGDGAAWWPDIEISKTTGYSENEILIEGVLKSVHDVYSRIYTFHFEAVAVINTDSLFGGYTLKELNILNSTDSY